MFYLKIFIAMFLMLGCPGFAAARTILDFEVVFEVRNGELEMKYFNGHRIYNYCGNRVLQEGCINLQKHSWGKIEFILDDGDANCEDPESWRIQSVQLGGEGPVEEPREKPQPGQWGEISTELATDLGADAQTGFVELFQYNKKTVRFQNDNQHRGSVWFQLTVESCSGDENSQRKALTFESLIFNGLSPGVFAPNGQGF